MTTIVFVHGTGNREPHFSETFKQVERSLHALERDLKVIPCYWGGTFGTKLNDGGTSIPLYDSTRGWENVEDEDYQLALWEQLYQDPLYELRALSNIPTGTKGFTPGQAIPGEELDERIQHLRASSPALQDKLQESSTSELFDNAKRIVMRSKPYLEVIRMIPESSNMGTYCSAVARAIVAEIMAECEKQEKYSALLIDAGLRDEVVQLLGNELGNSEHTRSIDNWMAKQLFGLAMALRGMNQVQRKRGAITDATYPFAGDVLLYQGRGDEIRSYIRQCIQQAEPPVVILAHSLGGIACVDLLVLEQIPEVKLLVTVGSQAPFLYEINALHSLQYGEALPSHFPEWLNIYDLHDFLSYVGSGVFRGKVQDFPVDSRQPFPRSHSAYWTNPATWKALERRLPKL